MDEPPYQSGNQTPEHSPRSLGLVWVFLLMAGVAGWMLSRSWHASILDRYEFRQLQTALSIFWTAQDGFHLAYLTPLFGPPWSIPMEFPTYQWCVSVIVRLGLMEVEPAGRLVSILFYAATLPAIYGLLGLAQLSPSRRLLVLAVILSTPVYLFYTRTVMIETTALCFSVWYLLAFSRTLSTGKAGWFIATCLFALLAALTKITTFAVYAAPAAMLALAALRQRLKASPPGSKWRGTGRSVLVSALPMLLALGLTWWWVAFGDAIKHSNPYTGFLASTELQHWNYGTLALRLDPSFWVHLWQNITQNLLSEGALVLGLVAFTFARPVARRIALVCLGGFFTGPLVFANLYHVHDYYYTANALLLTGATGLLLASAWDNPRLTAGSRWLMLTLLLLLQYRAFDSGYYYYYWKAAPPPPDLAVIMRETIPPDGVVLISGDDWNPLLPYYAQRCALMVAGGRDNEFEVLNDVLARLSPQRITAMVLVGAKLRHQTSLIQERVQRFGLSPKPFATSDDADLYLPADDIPLAAAHFNDRHFTSARVLISPNTKLSMSPEVTQDWHGQAFPGFSPAPLRSRSQFGLNAGTVEDLPAILAHAPSELYFQPPANAHNFSAVVGLAPSAYAEPLPAASDGVVVEIFEQQPNGLRRSLLQRSLTPATKAQDRGPQKLTYENGQPFAGELVFTLSPGPANNPAYDQAYWADIDIH
ncbi:MAG: glycosyltransferase family 39 protein [Cephaloticoccus sp.]|nr:glycosyltransferase family 39 protein [Cephaloticoccus sp.]